MFLSHVTHNEISLVGIVALLALGAGIILGVKLAILGIKKLRK